MRIAQLQSLDEVLRRYKKFIEASEAGAERFDADHDPNGFIVAARKFIDRAFVRKYTVELDETFFQVVLERVGEDLATGALGNTQVEPAPSDDAAVEAVIAELKSKTGLAALPPRFEAMLRGRDDPSASWLAGYRAFLCEQLKSSPRFREILNTVMLEEIRSTANSAAMTWDSIDEAVRSAAGEMRDDLGHVGQRLGVVESQLNEVFGDIEAFRSQFGSIERRLAEMVDSNAPLRIGISLQTTLDGAFRTIGERAFYASAERILPRIQSRIRTVTSETSTAVEKTVRLRNDHFV